MKNELGQRIKDLRELRGLTQKDLAVELSFSDKVISKWENGNSDPDVETLIAISQLFNVTLDYLLTGNTSVRELDAISKIELACKEDNIGLLNGVDLDAFDSNGRNIDDYINQYNSKNVGDYINKIRLEQKIDEYQKLHNDEKTYYICGLNKNLTNPDDLLLMGITHKREEVTKICSRLSNISCHDFKVFTSICNSDEALVDYEVFSMSVMQNDGKRNMFITWNTLSDLKSAILEFHYYSFEDGKRKTTKETFFVNERKASVFLNTLKDVGFSRWECKLYGCPICHIHYVLKGKLSNEDDCPGFFYVYPEREQYIQFVKSFKQLCFDVMYSSGYKRFINNFNDKYEKYYRLGMNFEDSSKLFSEMESEMESTRMKKRN